MKLDLSPEDRPFLPRGVRVIDDRVRGGKVLLGPERAIALDPIGEAILSRLDGETTFEKIIADLASNYAAPHEQIRTDVQSYLTDLRVRMLLQVKS